VNTFGTGVVGDPLLERAVREVFDLRPARLIADLKLRQPIYSATAAYGHFGRSYEKGTYDEPGCEPLRVERFTWARTNHIRDLKSAVKA
jgi:S-adenosylmethionine synthetase